MIAIKKKTMLHIGYAACIPVSYTHLDYDQTAVARVMSGTAAGVVEAYNKYAKGPTIIFAASLDEVRDITRCV